MAAARHDDAVIDVNQLGRALPRVRIQADGLLLRPWFRRSLLVPWASIKGVRIVPLDRWSGRGASPGGHGHYMIQVKLAGGWHRIGHVRRVRHAVLPLALRENLFGPRPFGEMILHSGYELILTLWTQAGGVPGDEDDNWPKFDRDLRPYD